MIFKKKYLALLIIVLFAILLSCISLVNHFLFRTYALDLGLYTNALFKYSHLTFADCNVFKTQYELLLADHFDLYLILFSPLVYLFGSYTLLVIQIVFVLIGALGVYRFFYKDDAINNWLPIAAMLYFLTFFGVFSAISFDYHSNVIAASILPWFFYFLKRDNHRSAIYSFIFILIAKENMAIWMVFVCLGLLLQNHRNKLKIKLFLALILVSVLYFILVLGYVMPKLSVSGKYDGFKYNVLGDDPMQALFSFFQQPLQSIKLLFINPTGDAKLDWIKGEFHLYVLISGLYLLVFKPQYLLMLIPIYMQKMYHNDPNMWGIGKQYSIEFAPILSVGVFSVIESLRHKTISNFLKYFLVFSCLAVTVRSMDKTIAYTKKSSIRFYQSAHYSNNFNVSSVRDALKILPQDSKVSALSFFIPHLALRNNIYQFPIVNDADYIVFNFSDDYYPLNSKKFIIEISNYLKSGNWSYLVKSSDIAILRRNQVNKLTR